MIALIRPRIDSLKQSVIDQMPQEERDKYLEYHPNDVPIIEALSYSHPDFEHQLKYNIRSFELDVYRDPHGNLFNNPQGYLYLNERRIPLQYDDLDSIGLSQPGLKVLHIPDLDFRSHYTTFKDALMALRTWSDQHPQHVPIFIMLEAKSSGKNIFDQATEVIPFDEQGFRELDNEIIDVLGYRKLIVPDDVRRGYASLEEAVLAKNWPELEDCLGKFVFLLLPSTAGLGNENAYVTDNPNLIKRVCFVQSEPGDPYAAFLLRDNALVRKEEIRQLVNQGYLVRTRADIETYEAKINDRKRANAALESGAQIVSTDYFLDHNNYKTAYKVELPNHKAVRQNGVKE